MDKEELLKEIKDLIDREIRSHETRVGWVSGIIGIFFTIGIVHSIWMVKVQLMQFTHG